MSTTTAHFVITGEFMTQQARDFVHVGLDDDMTAVEQVEMTREAVAAAMKVVTKFRARAVKAST